MSMKPGATTSPAASITRPARSRPKSPTAVTVSPVIPTSARTPGAPVPSTTNPPAIFKSIMATRMISDPPMNRPPTTRHPQCAAHPRASGRRERKPRGERKTEQGGEGPAARRRQRLAPLSSAGLPAQPVWGRVRRGSIAPPTKRCRWALLAALRSALHGAGREPRNVVVDEERVDQRHGDGAEQRRRHELAPVEDIAADQLG